VLTALGMVCAGAAAALTAWGIFGADGTAFIDARYVGAADVACGAAKALLCGLYIPLAASWHGLRARGGASAVGAATTAGVVAACFGCLVIDLWVDQAFLIAHA